MTTQTELHAEPTAEQSAFIASVEKYRAELQLHCYRMLASYDDAQDQVQETFLRAWKSRASLRDQGSTRAWLYRIATNACLDFLARHENRMAADQPLTEVPWLQPYPDRLLDMAANDAAPDIAVVTSETIELAFLVAIQVLPPNARAVLLMRDVLGWSAKETAELLETSVAAINSALQRARATLKRHIPERSADWVPNADPSEEERALVQRYMDAAARGDAQAFLDLMREDARFSMPPEPGIYMGAETIVQTWVEGGFGSESFGTWRCIATRANRQPAVVAYLRRPGDSEYRLFAMDVLRIVDGKVADVTAFFSRNLREVFDLPATLPA